MGKKVRSAKLIMGAARPGDPKLEAVSRVTRTWHEGGDAGTKERATIGAVTWSEAVSGKDGLKWERDGAAGGNDAQPISGAQTSFANDILSITGLEAAVQLMVDNPQENYGFRIAFSNAVAFFSNDSLADGPQLAVTFEDAPPAELPDLRVLMCEPSPSVPGGSAQWDVTFENDGATSVAQTVVVTRLDGDTVTKRVAEPLPHGGSRTVSLEIPIGPSEQPVSTHSFVVRVASGEGDKVPSDNGLTVYPRGLAVAFNGPPSAGQQGIITDFNERVFPFSKFGAWPNGCVERLRLVSSSANSAVHVDVSVDDPMRAVLRAVTGLPDSLLRPYTEQPPSVAGTRAAGFISDLGQVGLLPDTRDDVLIPRDLAIPDRTSTTSLFGEVPMNEWGMLSRSEVTIINSQMGKPRALPWESVPSMVFIRVFTPDGAPPAGAKIDIYQMVGGAFGSQPVFSANLEADGSALMPSRDGGSFGRANPFGDLKRDGSNGWLLAVVRLNNAVQTSWIPVWQLWDEFARGNQAAAFIEIRVQLASGPLDTAHNLALGRLVTDSKGRFPAELNALVDGKGETSLALADEPDPYWIDIDLGRDLQIGQVQLVFEGPVWKQFRILTYKTAQSADDAIMWAEEANGPASTSAEKTEDGKTVLSYTTRSVRSRFVRIVPLTREPIKLSEIRVVPIRTG
jgi:hypothetical protein